MSKIFDVQEQVYTILRNRTEDICPNTGMSPPDAQTAFPYTSVITFANEAAAEDMENNENAIKSIMEVSVFSDVSAEETRNIMSAVSDTMREMGYQRKGPIHPKHPPDIGIFRIIYRFNRIIGVGEEL